MADDTAAHVEVPLDAAAWVSAAPPATALSPSSNESRKEHTAGVSTDSTGPSTKLAENTSADSAAASPVAVPFSGMSPVKAADVDTALEGTSVPIHAIGKQRASFASKANTTGMRRQQSVRELADKHTMMSHDMHQQSPRRMTDKQETVPKDMRQQSICNLELRQQSPKESLRRLTDKQASVPNNSRQQSLRRLAVKEPAPVPQPAKPKRRPSLSGAAAAMMQRRARKEQPTAMSERSEIRLQVLLRTLQALCAMYAALVLLPKSGIGSTEWATEAGGIVRLCPRVAVCSEGVLEVTMIVLARLSAWWMIPPIAFVFLSKCRILVGYLGTSSLSLWLPLSDLHHMHSALGKEIAWMTLFHTIVHLIRWGVRGDLSLLYDHAVGRSGTIAALVTIPVVLLMCVIKLQKKYRWELRFLVHKIGALAFAVGLTFHTTMMGYFMTTLLVIYFFDSFLVSHFFTHRVDHSLFTRLGTGTQLAFKNPPNWSLFGSQLGYIRVCVPWVSKSEWHPFSVYPDSLDPENNSAIFMVAAGDWTNKVHKSIERDSSRPVWIQGPFASPYAQALTFDNLLLVATGIGITPAVACLQQYKEDRRCNLIWTCRLVRSVPVVL
jgi:hypothetical protein